MKISIKVSYLPSVTEFLYNLTLKGKQSRHRSRLVKAMQEKWKEVVEEEQELLKEYAGVDEEGNPKKKDGQYDIKDVKGFKEQQKELFDEEFILEGGDATGYLKTVKEIVFDYDEEVSGKDAEAYDYLCEVFEESENENKEENK
ncbi:hypothetical protein M3599_23410 [Niallia circulans]|uniref:hypothetical protein n=1 Tax=Niallia circulans TaxID=1397 RepID=UPI00203EE2AC|nr:hypothetical protein [Niallia circulans]MCM2983846.1 hypothetical protein [Niallia circulans]